ncbi:MFS transporter [Burkholderia cepacia]|uniref:MFS transporter n=1 Tax=Burkholderia cepacia TaxID=292 RepID=UPI000755FAD1|nr:MFS transporter [Burkholderia cepacia]KWC91787.1 hypothetical protein WL56_06605 [Burkholderia cepacia]
MPPSFTAERGTGVDQIEAKTMKKVMWRLLPLLMGCYVASFLDRVNIGFAGLEMNGTLGLSSAAFGLGAGLFFLPYFLLEVPSNLALNRFGARLWIARIMITWGIISGAFAFIAPIASALGTSNRAVFYGLRFLLGAAEAGFFPGIIFFLTLWFPAAYRARVIALFMLAIPISAIIGSPLSGLLMSIQTASLKGWQWLFIIEAAPSVILGLCVIFMLVDRPTYAGKWLSQDERDWLTNRLESEKHLGGLTEHGSIMQALRNGRVLTCAFIYFALNAGAYGLYFFLPTIVKSFGVSNFQTGLLAALPFVFGGIGMVLLSRNSDRTLKRRVHLCTAIFIAAAGVIGAGLSSSPVAMLAFLCFGMIGVSSMPPLFWPVPSSFLTGTQAAAGIAAINAIGSLSGFVGPYYLGFVKDLTGGFSAGLVSLGCCAVASGIAALLLRMPAEPPTNQGPVTTH